MKSRDVPPDGAPGPQIGEASARLAAERMAFAANALPALIAYLDTSVRYVWVNDTYPRWFGRHREEIVGQSADEVLGPSAWAAVKPYTERALAGEEVAFDNTVVLEGGSL
ncbi:MAG TPA: PAS domain-containing protein, partial [Polyangia bacterium]|nr:PAS domain-containing protein [Polyangia bacterium]